MPSVIHPGIGEVADNNSVLFLTIELAIEQIYNIRGVATLAVCMVFTFGVGRLQPHLAHKPANSMERYATSLFSQFPF